MRNRARLLAGGVLGIGGVLAYLWFVGVGDVASTLRGLAPAIVVAVAVLVVVEGVVDGIGVWASVRPLGEGLTGRESVQFALAGDFFDIVSPAGAASSEPIMAQFVGTATETSYSEALGVRSVAKYVKAGGQVLLSASLGLLVLRGQASSSTVLTTLGAAVVVILVLGVAVGLSGGLLSRLLVAVLEPVVRAVSAVVPGVDPDDGFVREAVGRFGVRVAEFRDAPALVGLIALGGIIEQAVVATALWVLLSDLGVAVALAPIVVVVPLPQAATVVPVPASLGTYDVLLGGALALTTGAPAAVAAAAVVVFRGLTLLFGLATGGFCAALLRGWDVRPGAD
ncbi:hypothetical protein JCM30237_19660 [Halolamina litorea]|uniref:Lysylphosphatidylglycerol synthase domain-containing protein n=1 Tax=Halolamina litorea TaxID=1515593 RepID=A0ABD6BTH7_9EURY|nr:lysylphosphatidylglycerol synthase domain-containing protein [Halolamina litorea]